jgi:sulfotransferase family protein
VNAQPADPGGAGHPVPDEQAERSRSLPDPSRPIFIAGPDRSGTTLMFAILSTHSGISMSRRTNMWRFFHRRYGDLADPAHLERCLDDMTHYRRMRWLQPDADRIRREFRQGEPTYGRLFSLFHEHKAERAGKPRWGDKSLHTEHFAERVFTEFPEARIVHMLRDPRDRYASAIKRHGRDVHRVAAASGRWLRSTRAGLRNAKAYPGRYLIVRYEDLAREPEATMHRVCDFLDEPYEPAMLEMGGAPEHRDAGGNSSFGDLEPGTISTKGIGRFRTGLSPMELRYLETTAGRPMRMVGYVPVHGPLPRGTRLRYFGWFFPVNALRMVAWMAIASVRTRRGGSIPRTRLAKGPGTEIAGEH